MLKAVVVRLLKRALNFILYFLAFFLILVLLFALPVVQKKIAGLIIEKVNQKTTAIVSLDRIYIGFTGNIHFENLFIVSPQNDTLVGIRDFTIALNWPSLVSNNKKIRFLKINGLVANISRAENGAFNFEAFLPKQNDALDTLQATQLQSKKQQVSFWLQQLSITNTQIAFLDTFSGTLINANWEAFNLQQFKFDLATNSLNFGATSLKKPVVSLIMGPSFALTDTTTNTESDNLFLTLKKLHITDASFDYKDVETNFNLHLNNKSWLFSDFEMDTKNPAISLEKAVLFETKAVVLISDSLSKNNKSHEDKVDAEPNDFLITLGKLSGSKNELLFVNNNSLPSNNKKVNFNNLHINDLVFDFSNISYNNIDANASINQLSFVEQSGFAVKKLKAEIEKHNDSYELDLQILEAPNSKVSAQLKVAFGNQKEAISFHDLRFQSSARLSFQDFAFFDYENQLANLPKSFFTQKLEIDFNLNGDSNQLQIKNLVAKQGDLLKIDLKGHLKNFINPEKLAYNVEIKQLTTNGYWPNVFAKQMGILVPNSNTINGSFVGQMPSEHSAIFDFKSSLGSVAVDAQLAHNKQYEFDLTWKKMQIGSILQNPKLGTMSGSLTGKGVGFEPQNLSINTVLDVSDWLLFDTINQNLHLSINANSGKFVSTLSTFGQILDFESSTTVDFMPNSTDLVLNGNCKKLNLQAFGLPDAVLETNLYLKGKYIDSNNQIASLVVNENSVVKENAKINFADLNFDFKNTNQSLKASLNSEFLHIKLQTDSLWQHAIAHLQNSLNAIANSEYETIKNDTKGFLSLQLEAIPNKIWPIINKGLMLNSPLLMQFEFNEGVNLQLNTTNFYFNNIGFDSLSFALIGPITQLDYLLNLRGVQNNQKLLGHLYLNGSFQNQSFFNHIIINDYQNLTAFNIESKLNVLAEGFNFQILPKNLKLAYQLFDINSNNNILFSKEKLQSSGFHLQSGKTEIALRPIQKNNLNDLQLTIRHVNIAEWIKPFLPDSSISAQLNADFHFDDIFNETRKIDGTIDLLGLGFRGNDFGEMHLLLQQPNSYSVNNTFNWRAPNIQLSVEGNANWKEKFRWKQAISLEKFIIDPLVNLVGDPFLGTTGLLHGNLLVNNFANSTHVIGDVIIDSLNLLGAAVPGFYRIYNQKVVFDKNKIIFNNFTLSDSIKNNAILAGVVDFTNLQDLGFDLTLTAKKFSALNKKMVNATDLYSGNLLLDADLSIKGNSVLPIVRGELSILDQTKLRFAIPETVLSEVERESVITFVDEVSLALKADSASMQFPGGVIGYDVDLRVSVDPKTNVVLVIDPESGDQLDVAGAAKMQLTVLSNGQIGLSGRYELTKGSYQLNFFEVLKRDFSLIPGGFIRWQGDPLQAEINLSARYEVRASAIGLLSNNGPEATGQAASNGRTDLPFFVDIIVTGEMLKPQIEFKIDLPKNQRGAFGGAVYNALQQINADENERNKQAFALLVMGGFLGQGSAGGGGEQWARSSVSKLLSQQLNNLAANAIKGGEFNLNLDSYDGGDGFRDQTNLQLDYKQKLFNDRLQIQVGSQVALEGESARNQGASDIAGDLIVEYLLTADGRLRLKGFRKTAFEGLVDGQLISTGISFIVSREYNNFKELFQKKKVTKKVDAVLPKPTDPIDSVPSQQNPEE